MRKSAAASGFLGLVAMAGSAPALAASSGWASGEGASIRLVTAGPPAADGTLRAALDIALEPGWKTYWRDPGSAGVPPSLDLSKSPNVSATLDFPAPERHDDGYGAWAGYAMPVALPVLIRVTGAAPGAVEAEVFLGVCRDICVPFSATLTLDPSAGDDLEDTALVEAAFAALPKPANKDFGVTGAARRGDTLLLDARLPAGAGEAPVLFVAGAQGYAFGVPQASGEGSAWRFAVPVLDGPKEGGGVDIPYTLEAGEKAVSGTFAAP